MSGLLPKRRRPPADDDARVLPLINVVFLLLVFFMAAGRLEPAPPFDIAPLRAASGAPEAQAARTPPRVLVAADGALGFEGARISRDALLSRIARLSQGPGGAPLLELQADARADALQVAGLMQALRARGVASFRLLVAPTAPERTP